MKQFELGKYYHPYKRVSIITGFSNLFIYIIEYNFKS